MKYAGTISIVDDDGEIVFERELSSDEIIQMLLEERDPVVDVPIPRTGEPKRRKRVDLRERIAEKRKGGTASSPCEDCGSKGTKHKKGCPKSWAKKGETMRTPVPVSAPALKVGRGEARMENGRPIFSEATYDKVMKRLERDGEWEIVADLGIDASEVSRIANSESYEDYVNSD